MDGVASGDMFAEKIAETISSSLAKKCIIAKVNGEAYRSGMNVVLDYGSKVPVNAEIYIDTEVNVNSVSYEINGQAVPGGDVKQAGSSQLAKIAEDGKTVVKAGEVERILDSAVLTYENEYVKQVKEYATKDFDCRWRCIRLDGSCDSSRSRSRSNDI